MDELDKTNVEIVNSVIKLTTKGVIKWETTLHTKSSPECYLSVGSTAVRYSTTVGGRLVDLTIIDDLPRYVRLEGIPLIDSTQFVKELSIPPVLALFRAIKGTVGNLEVKSRRDFLTDLQRLVDGCLRNITV